MLLCTGKTATKLYAVFLSVKLSVVFRPKLAAFCAKDSTVTGSVTAVKQDQNQKLKKN